MNISKYRVAHLVTVGQSSSQLPCYNAQSSRHPSHYNGHHYFSCKAGHRSFNFTEENYMISQRSLLVKNILKSHLFRGERCAPYLFHLEARRG